MTIDTRHLPDMMQRRGGLPVLLLVLGAAALLRLVMLGQAPLWGDEAATSVFATLPWTTLFQGIDRMEPNPPTFYVLEKLWTGLAGASDFALRLPSAVAGVVAVGAVWALARGMAGPRAALWAGGLMATQAQHLEFSREARVYALLVMAVALAAVAARRLVMAERPRLMDGALLAAAGAAAIWLHHTGVVGIASVFAYAGVLALRGHGPVLARPVITRLALLAAAGLGVAVLAAPSLLSMVAYARAGAGGVSWIPRPDLVSAAIVVVAVLSAPLAGVRALPGPLGGAVLALGLVLVAGTVAWAVRRMRTLPDAAALLAGLLAGVAMMAGISQVTPILIERTLLFTLVFFVPLLGAALAAARPARRLGILAALALAQGPGLVVVYGPTRHDEDWRALAAGLQAEATATGWPVIVNGWFELAAIDRYLPPGAQARPALAIMGGGRAAPGGPTLTVTPLASAQGTQRVTWLMDDAHAAASGPSGLCAVVGSPGGVLLAVRDNASVDGLQAATRALLAQAGGVADGGRRYGRIMIERWRGVCPPPG